MGNTLGMDRVKFYMTPRNVLWKGGEFDRVGHQLAPWALWLEPDLGKQEGEVKVLAVERAVLWLFRCVCRMPRCWVRKGLAERRQGLEI